MVAAQLLNQDDRPVYGAYIIGRYWHFVFLMGKGYTVNPGYNAAREEIFDIFRALRNTRRLIDQAVQS